MHEPRIFIAGNHCVQPPPDISSISLEDWRKEAPIKCTVVGVPIEKRPRAVRRHLVQQLRVLERQTGRSYRGYVMRVSSTLVKAHIVTENTESEDDMGYLWGFLKENWGSVINPRDITYANNDSGNLCYLCDDRMEAVRTDAEDGDWSRVLEPDDLPICGDDAFSVVSRLPWTEGEDGAVQQTAEW